MCQTKINQLHKVFSLIVGGFLQFGPTVLCELWAATNAATTYKRYSDDIDYCYTYTTYSYIMK